MGEEEVPSIQSGAGKAQREVPLIVLLLDEHRLRPTCLKKAEGPVTGGNRPHDLQNDEGLSSSRRSGDQGQPSAG